MGHIAVFGYLLFWFSCFLPKLHFSGVQYHANSAFGLFPKPCSVFQFYPFCEVCFYAKKTVTDCRVGHLRDKWVDPAVCGVDCSLSLSSNRIRQYVLTAVSQPFSLYVYDV